MSRLSSFLREATCNMILQLKYGWEPDGEAADMAAQMDEQTAQALCLFDRCGQWLIFNNQQDAHAAAARLSNDDSPELFPLLMAAANTCELTPTDRFDDFARTSARGHHYMDFASIRVFRLQAALPDAELAAARLQLEEHLIATFTAAGRPGREERDAWHAIESHLDELAERIARAYRCEIVWFDDP